MKVVTLVENQTASPTLAAEHGLSLYLETEKLKILFDTGATDLFALNAEKLNINLLEVDYVIISHGHYDHIGGLIHLLKLNNKAKVILKKEIFESQYLSVRHDTNKEIGFVPELLNYKERFIYLTKPIETIDNLHIISNIETLAALPKGNKMLFKTSDNSLIPDDFNHELILVIEEYSKIHIFCGCAHNGILNTINTAQKHLPNKVIKSVIGGFHLIERNEFIETESDKEVDKIALKLKQLNSLTKYYTGHCTSTRAYDIMKSTLGNRLNRLVIGEEIES